MDSNPRRPPGGLQGGSKKASKEVPRRPRGPGDLNYEPQRPRGPQMPRRLGQIIQLFVQQATRLLAHSPTNPLAY